MLWQFGELGFDFSINRCENGSNNPPGTEGGDGDCRLSIKPPVWDYKEDPDREHLFEQTANFIRLKKKLGVFQNGTATFSSDNLSKQVIIRNKNYTAAPVDSTQMSAVVAANFDLIEKNTSVSFPHAGTWYDFQTGQPIEVAGAISSYSFMPGSFMLFTNVRVSNPLITGLQDVSGNEITIYPNPVVDFIATSEAFSSLYLVSVTGSKISLEKINNNTWDPRSVVPGLYVAVAERNGLTKRFKIIKR
jgi:hypothetical protein